MPLNKETESDLYMYDAVKDIKIYFGYIMLHAYSKPRRQGSTK